jgi:hypothetical protein
MCGTVAHCMVACRVADAGFPMQKVQSAAPRRAAPTFGTRFPAPESSRDAARGALEAAASVTVKACPARRAKRTLPRCKGGCHVRHPLRWASASPEHLENPTKITDHNLFSLRCRGMLSPSSCFFVDTRRMETALMAGTSGHSGL